VLALIAIARFWRTNGAGNWLAAAILPFASAGVLLAWYLHLYGSPIPPGSDHAGFSGPIGALNGLAGTFLDQQWGAFIHNPLLLLATASMVPFTARFRGAGLAILIVVLPYVWLISAYRIWWGEWNPPARYLADVIPLAAAPLGWWLSTVSNRIRVPVLLVAGVPALIVSVTFLYDPQLMYNQPDGTSRLLETWSRWVDRDLTTLIPSYVFYSASPVVDRITFVCLAMSALAACAMLTLAASRSAMYRTSPERVQELVHLQ
jgi:hypothetical protein